jgi:ABC-type lipoprotein release transport system permease subunit
MTVELFLGVAIGAVAAFIIIQFILSRRKDQGFSEELEKRLTEMFPKVLQNASEQLISLANEKLDAFPAPQKNPGPFYGKE